ncbi:hypothetical protein [Thalassotalea atypica]|uniref:hypothetical protein n=1 Tax=Thalassotalea atypica TaxID=2054316 RepID=UPI00257426A6|nr:hypothetical protein [Thalassotalea atypica]
MAGKFETLLDDLKDVAIDFSKLTVTTATGDIEAALSGKEVDLNKVDMEELFKDAATGKVDGNLIIAAVDSYKLDGDAFVFRTNNPKVSPEMAASLEEAHTNAVIAGQSLRDGIFDIVKDGIETLVKK